MVAPAIRPCWPKTKTVIGLVDRRRARAGGEALGGDGDGGVGADLEAAGAIERGEGVLGHEEVGLGIGLGADLEAERGRGEIVVGDGGVVAAERALAELAAEAEAGLHDLRKDEDGDSLVGQRLGGGRLAEQGVERDVDLLVDLRGRGGAGLGRGHGEEEAGEEEAGGEGGCGVRSWAALLRARVARSRSGRQPAAALVEMEGAGGVGGEVDGLVDGEAVLAEAADGEQAVGRCGRRRWSRRRGARRGRWCRGCDMAGALAGEREVLGADAEGLSGLAEGGGVEEVHLRASR